MVDLNSKILTIIIIIIIKFVNNKIWSFLWPNGPGDRSSIPGLVIPKTQKMLLNDALLNTAL